MYVEAFFVSGGEQVVADGDEESEDTPPAPAPPRRPRRRKVWRYSDYITADDPRERERKLRRHIAEVSEALTRATSQSMDGGSYTRADLTAYRAQLLMELKELQTALGLGGGDGVVFLRGRLG